MTAIPNNDNIDMNFKTRIHPPFLLMIRFIAKKDRCGEKSLFKFPANDPADLTVDPTSRH
jgi:hypothetical protein